eukprot:187129-Prymnesium_polylepis.1
MPRFAKRTACAIHGRLVVSHEVLNAASNPDHVGGREQHVRWRWQSLAVRRLHLGEAHEEGNVEKMGMEDGAVSADCWHAHRIHQDPLAGA